MRVGLDQLNACRYELVPKKVKEEEFWRNYFYRVSLIKQSFELKDMEMDKPKADAAVRVTRRQQSRQKSTGDEEVDMRYEPTTDLCIVIGPSNLPSFHEFRDFREISRRPSRFFSDLLRKSHFPEVSEELSKTALVYDRSRTYNVDLVQAEGKRRSSLSLSLFRLL